MSTATRTQRRYDHRLKELVRTTGNIDIALESGVPRSTPYGWLKRSHAEVVSLDVHNADVHDLQREVVQLRRRNARLVALLRLIMTTRDQTLVHERELCNDSEQSVGPTDAWKR